MKRRLLLILGLLTLLLVTGAMALHPRATSARPAPQRALATTHCSSTGSYCLDWQVLGGGIAPMESDNFRVRGTLGQTVAGLFSGNSYDLMAGYWAGFDLKHTVYVPTALNGS